jgi:SNF2 family DNA or RNA helicase
VALLTGSARSGRQFKNEIGEETLDAMDARQIIAPFVLRRLKSEVLSQLTPKTDVKREVCTGQLIRTDVT